MSEAKPLHSPLGASSAERWLKCPGSVALFRYLVIAETTDEPEYRGLGTAAHELAAQCLQNKCDAWELIGQKINNFDVDKPMADAVQVYLDAVRIPDDVLVQTFSPYQLFIEYRISHPAHKNFYGTLDSAVVFGDTAYINDYKHGEGISVDVEDNPQLMYYAYGFLREHPEIKRVILRIIQPRIVWAKPIKQWETTADYIKNWAETVLIPGMRLAEMDGGDLDAGDWCRFCPAKLVCPLMKNLFGAAMLTNPKEAVELSDASLGRSYNYIQAVKFYIKALEEEIFARLNRGNIVPGTKLVPKKANRVFKPEALTAAKEKFGDEAFSKPEMKSPAEIDKLGATGKDFTREFAYTPQTGLTVAAEDDSRVAVKVQSSQEAFGVAIKNLTL